MFVWFVVFKAPFIQNAIVKAFMGALRFHGFLMLAVLETKCSEKSAPKKSSYRIYLSCE